MEEMNDLLYKLENSNLMFEWFDPEKIGLTGSIIKIYNKQDIYIKNDRTIVYDIIINYDNFNYEVEFSLIKDFYLNNDISTNNKKIFEEQDLVINHIRELEQIILNS